MYLYFCLAHASILSDSQHPAGMKKIQELETKPAAKAPEQDKVFDKPVFTASLTGPEELWEGQHAHFQCTVVPVGDPQLKYEWFCNGVELKQGTHTNQNRISSLLFSIFYIMNVFIYLYFRYAFY
jgi:titin